MKKTFSDEVEKCRALMAGRFSTRPGQREGYFRVPFGKITMRVIVGSGDGWDHVSVSIANKKRNPRWDEMCHVKDLFFDKDEWVVQYHPAESDYVNVHPYVLHLWKPHEETIPTPPLYMV